jgi:hypothetical protein
MYINIINIITSNSFIKNKIFKLFKIINKTRNEKIINKVL